MISSIDVIAGGQFGSEAKGHVTKRVIQRNIHESFGGEGSVGAVLPQNIVNVRVAGPNAGHCVLDSDGIKFALRSVPVGAVIEDVQLHIAAGSEIDVDVLAAELANLEVHGHSVGARMTINGQATILGPEHIYREQGMQERMGSTGKGIGAARADRLMRTATLAKDDDRLRALCAEHDIYICDDDFERATVYEKRRVVIEGTQGYGLGLHAGFYPQCTSSNCRPIDFLAMANLDPTFVRPHAYTPWVVLRVFPIRVAGNSGPLKGETSWEDLGLPEEFTTVTKKVRRVGEFDEELAKRAIYAAGPNVKVALTMYDQLNPSAAGLNSGSGYALADGWTKAMDDEVRAYQQRVNWPISLITTSEDTAVWR